MPRSRKAALTQTVEKRTQQRLAARREAARRGAETRRRKREEAAQSAPKLEAAPRHTDGGQPQVAEELKGRPEASVAQNKTAFERASMVTVALRGEQAARLRALAASRKLSLSKLLVQMMDSLEAQLR